MPSPGKEQRPRKGEQAPQAETTNDPAVTGIGRPPTETDIANSAMLDSSNAGAPFIPAPTGGGSTLGAAGGGPTVASSNEELIVEVEFAPGTATVGSALTSNTTSFLAGTPGTTPPNSALSAVLRQYGLREARSVFTREQIQMDEAQTNALREAAALGAVSQDQLSARERLPSLSQFVRLRFPPGTPVAEVTDALKRQPEVARAVAVPRATPPMPLSTP